MHSIPDDELMRRVQRGDLEQVGVLFKRHQAMVHAHCYRMTGSRSAADDLLQECFLRVIRFRATWEERARFTTWLFRIVRNACLDHLRKKKRSSETFSALTNNTDVASESTNPVEQREDMDRLSRALQSLSPDRREIILMARFMDLSYPEIADILGCTVNNARVRLHRAISDLRDLFHQMEEMK